jgi:FKBP-type peptidyl-prolyl cis-trans isomerase FklB
MKIVKTTTKVLGLSLATLLSAGTMAQAEVDLESEDNKIAYSIGVNIGQSVLAQGILEGINNEVFAAGLLDAIADTVQMDDAQMMASIQAFQQQMMSEAQAALSSNLEASETFLAQNSAKQGVVSLPSGLQYLVLDAADASAPSPTLQDSVLAHYHGTLTDGSVFDSSVDRGQPATFGLSQVISGWTEALQLMKVGDKWRLFIPPSLAYGEASPSPAIPPNSALIFDVELLEIR